MLSGDPVDESWRCRLRDDQPTLGPGAVLDGVEQDGLPSTPGPGIESRPAGRSWTVVDGLEELVDEVISASQ